MTALLLLMLGLGALAAGILVGRYYVPDDRSLRRTARHAQLYVQALNHLLDRDKDGAVDALVTVVSENVDDVEPYFALGALFRNRGEWERAIRVHQAIELRVQGNRSQRRVLSQRARYQLGLDFRAAGMPRRATRAMEDCLESNPKSASALKALCSLYEEQGRFAEAAEALGRLAKISDTADPTSAEREHHLLCAAAQQAIESNDLASAKRFLKAAEGITTQSSHLEVAQAELAAAKGNWKDARAHFLRARILRPELFSYLAGPLKAAELEMRDGSELAHEEASREVAKAQHSAHDAVGDEPLSALAAAELLADVNRDEASELMHQLGEDNPNLLPVHVASARLALASGTSQDVSRELAALVGENGVLGSSQGGVWCCRSCARPAEFFAWRCNSCRHWGSPRLEFGFAARAPVATGRDRRAQRRPSSPEADPVEVEPSQGALSLEAPSQAAPSHVSALGRAGKWVRGTMSVVRGSSNPSSGDPE